MMQTTETPQDWSIPMPITQESQEIATRFANEQPTQEKALQIYLNTLAVCAVNNYLRIMDVPTDLTAGDSWNPAVRLAADVADLWVTGLGRLECRPVQASHSDVRAIQKPSDSVSEAIATQGASALLQAADRWFRFFGSKPTPTPKLAPIFCYVPPEVQSGRIGYVVVQIDAEQQEAMLLGFSRTAGSGQLVISQLQPVNEMLNHLETPKPLPIAPVNLSQWLQNVFEVGWQSVDLLVDTQQPSYAFRQRISNRIGRAKPLHLGTQLAKPTVALAVTLTQQQAANGISLQLLPIGDETYLPVGLKLTVLDESGETFLEVSSASSDRMIQTQQFGGQAGETFCVRVSLGENCITEEFAI